MKCFERLLAPVHALLSAIFLFVALDPAAAQEGRTCSVLSIEGAPVRMEAAGQWSPVEVGPLARDARLIATGPGARAELGCSGGLVLTVGAGTELDVAGVIRAAASEGVVLGLRRGMVGIDASGGSLASLEVHTPLAVASSEAATWLVEYSEPTGAGVFVRSGQVDVEGRGGGIVRLGDGQGVTILPGASRVQVLRWSATRIAGAGATLGFRWQ